MRSPRETADGGTPAPQPLDVTAIHGAHANFVFRSLQRFGVRDADLEDMVQEVFVVVHRRLDTFDGTARMTTWLYGISMRVASDYRRRAHVRRGETLGASLDDHLDAEAASPEASAQSAQDRALLASILDEMDLEKRAIFVMYEIDELSCDEIAAVLDAPLGTVHSRLHAARKQFAAALARWQARQKRGGS